MNSITTFAFAKTASIGFVKNSLNSDIHSQMLEVQSNNQCSVMLEKPRSHEVDGDILQMLLDVSASAVYV